MGRELLEGLLAARSGGEDSTAIARALDCTGAMSLHQGDYLAARGYFEQSLALFQQMSAPLGQVMALEGFASYWCAVKNHVRGKAVRRFCCPAGWAGCAATAFRGSAAEAVAGGV